MATKIEEFGGWKGLVLHTLVSSAISGAVIAVGLKWLFDKEIEAWRATRAWQTSALAEVIAPAVMHFRRTQALAVRYRDDPRYGAAVTGTPGMARAPLDATAKVQHSHHHSPPPHASRSSTA